MSGIVGARGGVLGVPLGVVSPPADLYPWVPLRFEDATAHAVASLSSAAAGVGDAIDWTINNDPGLGSQPTDYPSRADGLVWPAGYGLPEGVALDELGAGGWLPVFRLVTADVSGAAASASVWCAVGLGDQGGEADNSSCRMLLGGVRHTAGGRLCLATRRNADLISSANEATADTYTTLIAADQRRLNRAAVAAASAAGTAGDVTQTETGTYDLASMRIAMYAGADSTTSTGPHTLSVTAYVRWLPMLA